MSRILPRSSSKWLYFGIALILLILLARTPLAWAQSNDFVRKTVDLSRYGLPVSLDFSSKRQEVVIGFKDCQLLFLDAKLTPKNNVTYPGCKSLFGAKYGILNGTPVVVSSLYTGNSAVYDFQKTHILATHTSAVTSSTIVNDRILSTSDDGSVAVTKVFDLGETETQTHKFYESVGASRKLAIYPNSGGSVSRLAVSYDTGEIAIFPTAQDLFKQSPPPKIYRPIKSRVNALKFTPDGQSLIVGYFTGELIKLDLTSGAVTTFLRAELWLNSIAMNNAGLLITGDDQGLIQVLSYKTGKLLARYQTSPKGINSIVFLDEATILAIDTAGQLYECDLSAISPH